MLKRATLIAIFLSAVFPSTITPAETCPTDAAVYAREIGGGNKLYAAMHTSKGWVMLLFGTPSGDAWRAYAVNGRHDACLSSEGDRLEIVAPRAIQ